jgi:hypothetical protein
VSGLPREASAAFLALLNITPAGDPGEFDVMQRELDRWWSAGGSALAFIEQHRSAPAAAEMMSWERAYQELRRRYVSP